MTKTQKDKYRKAKRALVAAIKKAEKAGIPAFSLQVHVSQCGITGIENLTTGEHFQANELK